MERMQRLATRMVKGMRKLPYEERLRRLNLFSLARRHLRGDLILAYNIFHGRLDVSQAAFFGAPVLRNLREHNFKIRHRSFCLLRRKATYTVRPSGRCMTVPILRPSLIASLVFEYLHGFRCLTVPLFVNR